MTLLTESYTWRVTASDGNGHAIAPSESRALTLLALTVSGAGCSAAPGSSPLAGLTMLALMALPLLRRRRV